MRSDGSPGPSGARLFLEGTKKECAHADILTGAFSISAGPCESGKGMQKSVMISPQLIYTCTYRRSPVITRSNKRGVFTPRCAYSLTDHIVYIKLELSTTTICSKPVNSQKSH